MPTLTLINSMVVLLQGMGELQEARELYDEALQGRREVLGDHHPDTLNLISNMGLLLQGMGELQ